MYRNFNLTDEERKQIMEQHKSHGYKAPINEQLSQNQRDASFQAGPVSKERADKLAADGKLTASADNPIFNCVKNYHADDIASVKDVVDDEYTKNLKIEYKYEYFPDHMKVTYPYKRDSYSASQTIAYSIIEKFFTDGRFIRYEDGKESKKYGDQIWYCTGPRNYYIDSKSNNARFMYDTDGKLKLGANAPASGQPTQTSSTNCAASLSEIKKGGIKILKYGCKTDAVKELQKLLGMEEKHQTGYFGNITKAKVIEFQKANKDPEGKNLVPDGKVGDKTYSVMVWKKITADPAKAAITTDTTNVAAADSTAVKK